MHTPSFAEMSAFLAVAGLLTSAGAAKIGYGGWAAETILAGLAVYFTTAATVFLTRNLQSYVARAPRWEMAHCGL